MEERSGPRILAAERLNAGVVLQFEDGTCGFYSAALLYAMFPEADALDEANASW